MPSLRNILHKRDEVASDTSHSGPPPITITTPTSSSPPEITFLRSDTFGQEVIAPPTHADDPSFSPTSLRSPVDSLDSPHASSGTTRRSFQLFSRNRASRSESLSSPSPPRRERRLSNLLHRDNRRSRSDSRDSSVNIPQDLPQIDDDAGGDKQEREAAWEKRATVLAQHHPQFGGVGSPLQSEFDASEWGGQSRSSSRSRAGELQDDTNIQEAIRLHESGDLEKSTQMFGQLANPNGANNPLSQVLYGLALRHGWGCIKDEAQAVTYLSAAASNSAAVEAEALRAGIKKGGAAKGELVLAIFELANCFRNGWGVAKDPAAARQYYETAANLGDTDAMNEVAWCYLEGFGGKKEKFKAAKYYRLAEESGCPTVGNSWIWKEKYNPQ
ncbi:uncharacterized protein N7484_010505 [Penicillium longicatenatum]|uniref:uncharacterized protein n=1 Tax=Penicillium longicatenatum TaxID=1561947 RepID=UPI002548E6BF|nr:uncharacterized protein N7484_010505 [Penicillium longicatenatum]KAJ5630405.1 hypothetical protein N7484_010505 [Penicillium longicatenatum]